MTPSDSADAVIQTAPWLMTPALFLHIAGGAVAITSGYVAVLAAKGRTPHRVAGTVFFGSMLVMTGFALAIAAAKGQAVNLMAASLALYLVGTAWLTVRRPASAVGAAEVVAGLAGAGIAAFGFTAGRAGAGDFAGVVAVFAAVAALAALFDGKVILQRGIAGAGRISRHLWRMCAALFIATGSFFMGQMDEIPQAWRGPHLYVLAFAPMALLVFWLVRVRLRRGRAAGGRSPQRGRALPSAGS